MRNFHDMSVTESILTVFVILFFAGLFIVCIIGIVREHRKKKLKKQMQQYEKAVSVRTVTLTDLMMFGTIEAEYNTKTGMLTAEQAKLPKFGCQAPNRIAVEDYRDEDQDQILRILGRAYDNADEILTKMAEQMRLEIQFDDPDNLPEIAALKELICVTDFQFASGDEIMTMLLNAGAEYDNRSYSLTALYVSSPSHWEYEAAKLDSTV